MQYTVNEMNSGMAPAHNSPPPLISRMSARARGQSVVEMAFVIPIFFLLVFAVIDFGRLFFVQMTLQNAVRQAGRYAVTGNHLPDPKKPGSNLPRVDSIIAIAEKSAIGMDVKHIEISSVSGGNNSAGGPGDIVTISLETDLTLLTPGVRRFFASNGKYRFKVQSKFKNEPFSPSKTT